ncbi:MAG: BrnT family toxin [Spirochaetaceae bacterium]|nr:MAG: BrnT family toxin [Spirochaetaceae bacterium]
MESVSLPEFKGFDWDDGNVIKNWESHKVGRHEAEQVFFNHPLFVANDVKHSGTEPRYYVLGQTDHDRPLFVAFTIRAELIRVISARDMSRRERKAYQG